MAELSREEKDRISHRAIASARMRTYLETYLKRERPPEAHSEFIG